MSGPTGTTAAALRRLDLRLSRRLDGRSTGEHLGRRLGPGSEPEELARYQPGDDVRRIDWNVTSRHREPHVWRTRAEHELTAWVVLDETASMHFGTVSASKSEVAREIAAAIMLLVDGPGNSVGLVRLDEGGLSWTPPQSGRRAAVRLVDHGGARLPLPGTVGLDAAMAAADRLGRRPGLRLVVSDLLPGDGSSSGPFDWERPLRRASARHDVLVIEVVDPRELALPDVGPLAVVDPETGALTQVPTHRRELREAYAREAAALRAATGAAVRRAGAQHLVVRTDEDWGRSVGAHLRTHRRVARRAVRGGVT